MSKKYHAEPQGVTHRLEPIYISIDSWIEMKNSQTTTTMSIAYRFGTRFFAARGHNVSYYFHSMGQLSWSLFPIKTCLIRFKISWRCLTAHSNTSTFKATLSCIRQPFLESFSYEIFIFETMYTSWASILSFCLISRLLFGTASWYMV